MEIPLKQKSVGWNKAVFRGIYFVPENGDDKLLFARFKLVETDELSSLLLKYPPSPHELTPLLNALGIELKQGNKIDIPTTKEPMPKEWSKPLLVNIVETKNGYLNVKAIKPLPVEAESDPFGGS